MTGCLNASFYVSIKGISSKQSIGMINLAAALKESRQGLLLRLDGAARCLGHRQGDRKEVRMRSLSHIVTKKTWSKREGQRS